MVRWFLKLILLALLGFGFFHIAFREAPDFNLPTPGSELLAANLPGRENQPKIRVLLADAIDNAVLTINGNVRMEAVTMRQTVAAGNFTQSVAVDVTPTGQGVKIGTDIFVRAKLKSLDSQPLRLAWGSGTSAVNLSVPHEIEIYGTHVKEGNTLKAKVRILARLDIEDYLYGVLAGEVPTSWPLEALRAQAVASRSFAYFEIRSRKNEEYDVHPSTRSQVWRPSLAVDSQVKRAVDSTAGIVITEKNSLIKTFFHSECGGYTADARWVFTRTPIVALSGVKCPRCSASANRPLTWSVAYTRQEIAARLRKAGLLKTAGEIRTIQGLNANGGPLGRQLGRVVTVELTMAGGSGTSVRIPANDFRLAMGPDKKNIASTYLRIDGGSEPRVTFAGQGWGHGVGLCQHGAAYCADKLGYNFIDILALYYPGSKLVRLWGR